MRVQTPAATLAPRPQGGGRCVARASRGARVVIRASHHCHLMPANSRKSLRSGILNSINAKRMLVVVAGVVGLAGAAHGADISGAGATFPYPVYSKWADAYRQKTGVGLNYQSIGSGGGIRQIK